ncbi:MAG: selenocysteine synthase, partial [Acidobacteriaceae bacterium]|nr:selenocysteine synthase [Acidobacteriaceae bacterium]
ITAAVTNNAPISDSIGRGMKVAKEQIIGMVAAVDWFLSQSDEAMQAEFQARANRIVNHLKTIPTLQSKVVIPEVANHIPHLLLNYDHDHIKITAREVANRLRQGSPSIELNPATGMKNTRGLTGNEDTIVIGVWMLQPGEDLIVAEHLRQVLYSAV